MRFTDFQFRWNTKQVAGDGGIHCVWDGFVLWAQPDGSWRVNEWDGNVAVILVDSDDQTKGKDLGEAQQRAQAAAMIQHSLRR